jgi:hypothetical protein
MNHIEHDTLSKMPANGVADHQDRGQISSSELQDPFTSSGLRELQDPSVVYTTSPVDQARAEPPCSQEVLAMVTGHSPSMLLGTTSHTIKRQRPGLQRQSNQY